MGHPHYHPCTKNATHSTHPQYQTLLPTVHPHNHPCTKMPSTVRTLSTNNCFPQYTHTTTPVPKCHPQYVPSVPRAASHSTPTRPPPVPKCHPQYIPTTTPTPT